MVNITLDINNKSGLHARPAALFVQTAKSFKSSIRLRKDGKEADGKSILSVMTLGAKPGSRLELEITGEDEAAAARAIQELVEGNFGE